MHSSGSNPGSSKTNSDSQNFKMPVVENVANNYVFTCFTENAYILPTMSVDLELKGKAYTSRCLVDMGCMRSVFSD